ncbi:MAG TPA: phosphatase PAP2 family protein [Solirubrobacteraceae bacterium]|nr:phosphatase PAP2 family protein [Solirubrobacteraceae bacterium]
MSATYVSTAEPSRRLPEGRPGAAGPLGAAGLCLVALALTWVVTALVPAGQFKDAVALHDLTLLGHTHAATVAKAVLLSLSTPLFIAWIVALIAVALIRERPRVALAAGLVMALSPLTAEALKPLLAHPHTRIGAITVGPASWPSGHSSAALALVLCAVLVAPARRRAIVGALGAGFAVAVGCSLVILAWHMPSDVFGGYLLAALWVTLAVAGLRAADRRWPAARSGLRPGSEGVRAVRARVPQ